MNEDILRTKLLRAEGKVRQLESMIEDKTREVYLALRRVEDGARELRQVTEAVPAAVLAFDAEGRISMANKAAKGLLATPASSLVGWQLASFFPAAQVPDIAALSSGATPEATEGSCINTGGETIPVLASWAAFSDEAGERAHGVVVLVDIRARRLMEVELRQSQKLEAVGRLASGVAHEINTPAQFVSDSIHFLRDSAKDVAQLIVNYRQIASLAGQGQPVAELIQSTLDLEQEVDLAYILENVPQAFSRAVDGMQRVTTIVRSMKEFAHPDRREMSAININSSIDSVLVIARNEYKYIADAVTNLGDLPMVSCYGGEINQVLLNLVVNAAHAIEEKNLGTDTRGKIQIATELQGDLVRISVSDDGCGIPDDVRDRIFDPFFTTKAVGKGTGQGLAFVHTMVVDRHGGRIEVISAPDQGTTFHIYLPLVAAPMASAA
jgi:signal transduction histidine kinase